MSQLSLLPTDSKNVGGGRRISPLMELGAYEALWCRKTTSFKSLAERLAADERLPSDLVPPDQALAAAQRARALIAEATVGRFGVRVRGDFEYPRWLLDARAPVQFLYYQGWWNLLETRCVAVVGTRKPSAEAVRRTRDLTIRLVSEGWTIVSGLARGVDTIAHRAALDAGGLTIGVLGTPISVTYPKENRELQRRLAREMLVVSQVPVLRYSQQGPKANRFFFPERNMTMAALTRATIIVEAGETSGTLVQARAALEQGRKLLILDSAFQAPALMWPQRLVARGAVRVVSDEDVCRELKSAHLDR